MPAVVFKTISLWKISTRKAIVEVFTSCRAKFFEKQNTIDFLGVASRRIYTFVRGTLGVPFHKGLEDHPEPGNAINVSGSRKRTIGSNISIIYEALRNGQLHAPLMDCLSEAMTTRKPSSRVPDIPNGLANDVANKAPDISQTGLVADSEESYQVGSSKDDNKAVGELKRRHSIAIGDLKGRKRRFSLPLPQGLLLNL